MGIRLVTSGGDASADPDINIQNSMLAKKSQIPQHMTNRRIEYMIIFFLGAPFTDKGCIVDWWDPSMFFRLTNFHRVYIFRLVINGINWQRCFFASWSETDRSSSKILIGVIIVTLSHLSFWCKRAASSSLLMKRLTRLGKFQNKISFWCDNIKMNVGHQGKHQRITARWMIITS